MTQRIIQTYYLKSEIETYYGTTFTSTSTNPVLSDYRRLVPLHGDDVINITINVESQKYTEPDFYYNIVNITLLFNDFSSISGIYVLISKDKFLIPGEKFIFPTTSCTGKYINLSGYIVYDIEEEKRNITIVLNEK